MKIFSDCMGMIAASATEEEHDYRKNPKAAASLENMSAGDVEKMSGNMKELSIEDIHRMIGE